MKTTKRMISTILVVVMCLTMAPLNGFMEIKWEGSDFPEFDFSEIFTPEAKAARSGYYFYSVTDGKAEITDVNTSISGAVTIPSTLGGYPVTSIGNYAFEDCRSLTSVSIPDSVTSIGSYAFYGCDALTSVSIPDSVTSIGYGAFRGCSALTSVSIPDSVTSIGDSAFAACSDLTSVTIPDSVTSIGSNAFVYCYTLKSVSIPDSVTFIAYNAFYGCDKLTDVYYSGTQEQWQKISIDDNNSDLIYATIHYNAYNKLEAVFADSDTAKIKGTFVVAVTQTTVSQILSQAGSGAYISDKNGKQVAGDAYAGTGMTLTLSDGKKYTVVVLGDIDGDSKATAADARLSLRASVGLEKYDEASAQYKAANIQSDDKITAADARLILRASVGLEDAKTWMK